MWSIKNIKKSGKKLLKNNIWTLIFLGLFTSIIIGESGIISDGYENLKTVYYYFFEQNDTKKSEEDKYLINEYADKIVSQLLTGNVKENSVEKVTKFINDYNKKNNIYKGVIYGGFNIITKGYSQVQNTINSLFNFKNDEINKSITVFLTSIIGILVRILLEHPIRIGESRIYLESKNYKKTKIKRITYAFKKDTYFNCVNTIFNMEFKQFLWNFTIIGGIIKRYSYKMVTYIIAENPHINPNDAIKISEEMMKGNKLQAFKLDLSFIGWNILQIISFGLLGLYISPYYNSTFTELYIILREDYKKEKKYKYELLNDEILFQDNELDIYPDTYEIERKKIKIDYDKKYEPTSIIIFFFLFAFIGWIWEVLLFLFEDGVFINRGALYGPWLPIYGFGCSIIILLTCSEKFRKILKNPMLTFFSITTICTILEYLTSLYLEKTLGVLHWDYTGIFMNINGRVCFESSLFFGIGGCLCVYIVAPFLERRLQKVSTKIKTPICIILVTLILVDVVYSTIYPHVGEGITQERDTSKSINGNTFSSNSNVNNEKTVFKKGIYIHKNTKIIFDDTIFNIYLDENFSLNGVYEILDNKTVICNITEYTFNDPNGIKRNNIDKNEKWYISFNIKDDKTLEVKNINLPDSEAEIIITIFNLIETENRFLLES